jgi:hypothetical protein
MDSGALAGAVAAHHFATVLRSQWSAFWQRDTEEVLAELHSDLSKTLAVFSLNTQAGTAVNALLDAIGDDRFCNRAPVELPAFWTFTGTAFEFNPPPPPPQSEPTLDSDPMPFSGV